MTGAMTAGGHILVVDDDRLNRMLLTRALGEAGYTTETAENGRQALALLRDRRQPAFDIVLLDVLMPEMDGYQTLACIKEQGTLQHLPRHHDLGGRRHGQHHPLHQAGRHRLPPKPFNADLPHARLLASLAGKRLRDLELEYLEQVGHVTAAAAAVEAGTFAPESLEGVAARADALGQLARVFQRRAREVRAREERLQREVRELRIEIDQVRQAERVAEITETECFQRLHGQADQLRRIMDG